MALPEGLWLLPDRRLPIGQKQTNTLCVLCAVKQSLKYRADEPACRPCLDTPLCEGLI